MCALHSKLQLTKRIGAGHFGEVFLGNDVVHGDVAVKVLTQNKGEDNASWGQRRDGLLREAQRLCAARHTNVVTVHHLVEADKNDAIHLVMELCTGGSLQGAFDAGPMSLATVRRIATQITLGLQTLHARGMLHRDIKPGNILIDAAGTAKLGDFGLVTDDLVLGYGEIAGYSDHLAHELWGGTGTSERSDIWALGMTIYRLLHGAAWYARSPDPRTIVPHGGFADTLRWLPHIPKAWRRAIRSMLHDDPATRLQSATQVMSELARLPTDPDWHCVVSSDSIMWTRRAKARRIKVEWTMHSARRHEWTAVSEPRRGGKHSRRLASSEGIVGYAAAERGLKDFFAK